jgi:alpha-ribazole phosphatase
MKIYLIRHTTPLIDKGICYGFSDLDVANSFEVEAQIIKNILPINNIEKVYSSPLTRCSLLANFLFDANKIELNSDLKEINCGDWELQKWDDINQQELQTWMTDFVNVAFTNGESYINLYDRVVATFNNIISNNQHLNDIAIVSHGGVMRSILSFITNTPLSQSFDAFSIHYGCVVEVNFANDMFQHSILSNIKSIAYTNYIY